MIVELSTRAKVELDAAIAHLESENPRAANKLRLAIERAVETLGQLPRRGRLGRIAGTREVIVRGAPYVIVYAIATDAVFVLSIRHTSRGWPR